jgi:hypothetical protein
MPFGIQPTGQPDAIDTVLDAINRQPDPLGQTQVAPGPGMQLPPEILEAVGAAPAEAPQPTVRTQQAASGSFQGVTDAGLAQSKKVFSKTQQKTDAFMAPERAQTEAVAQGYRDSTDQQRTAYDEQAATNREYHRRDQELYERQADFDSLYATMQRRNHDMAKAEREQYLTGYREQLAGVKELIKSTGNPLGNLTGSESVGLGFAYFAQGFLGAQGVRIDVAGMVDNWVSRDIQSHQQKIANARESANDQLTLYNIARQSSEDEAEAYDRYRGFVIEGLKMSIQANASRFNSEIALSKAKEQSAVLDMHLTESMERLGNNFFAKRQQTYNMFSDEAYKQGQLGMLRANLNFEKQKHEDAKKAAAAKAAATNNNLVYDPATVTVGPDGKKSGGRVIGKVKDNDLAYKVTSEAMASRDRVSRGVENLKQLRSEVESEGGPEAYKIRFGGEAWNRWNNARNMLVNDIVKAMSGLTVNEKEREAYAGLLRDDAWLQTGGTGFQIDDLNEWSRANFESTITPHLDPSSVGQFGGDNQVYMPGLSTDQGGQAQRTMRHSGERPEQAPSDTQGSQAMDANANESTGTAPSKAYAEYRASTGQEARYTDTRGAEAIDNLVRLAVDGDKKQLRKLPKEILGAIDSAAATAGQSGDDEADRTRHQQEAYDVLRQLANDNKGGWSEYAGYMLHKLQEDPASALDLVSNDVEREAIEDFNKLDVKTPGNSRMY